MRAMESKSHPKCHTEAGHVCAVPSGRACYVKGCPEPAGTRWGPHWCPQHDMERLDRVSGQMQELVDLLDRS